MSREWTVPAATNADAELNAVLAGYLDAVDRGETPDRAALLVRYPNLAEQMRAFFADHDQIERLAGPRREEAATGLPCELAEEINRGGMGAVFRGRDRLLARELAVKLLLDRHAGRPEMRRRFVEEARITGQLQHPFIVPVHQLGELPDGRPFFTMKLIQGRTLADLLAERPADNLPRWLHVFAQVCQAVAFAHARGVIHRDLKPGNVMVGEFGEVQLMDWGLAKRLSEPRPSGSGHAEPLPDGRGSEEGTRPGSILGTIGYIPPEQARGQVHLVDTRSDVFGLGAILCIILTGQPPYSGTPEEVWDDSQGGRTGPAMERLRQSGVDAELAELACRCLSADPDDRPADAGAVAAAMSDYFAAVGERLRQAELARVRAETEAAGERQRVALAEAKAAAERRSRRAAVITAAAVVLLLGAAAAGGLEYQRHQADVAVRTALMRRDVDLALAEVQKLHEEGWKLEDDLPRWRLTLVAARSALKRAEEALERGEPDEGLRQRLAEARRRSDEEDRDCALLTALDRLRLQQLEMWDSAGRLKWGNDTYAAAFRAWGVELPADDPAAAARRIGGHRLRERLIDEINAWSLFVAVADSRATFGNAQVGSRTLIVGKLDWQAAAPLIRLLDTLEPDARAFRRRWRAARQRNDVAALLALAAEPQTEKLSALALIGLGTDLLHARADEAASGLLRRAVQRDPRAFWPHIHLGIFLCINPTPQADEALRHLTAALALRGPSSQVHIALSMAWLAKKDPVRALQAARRAAEIDPKSAAAQVFIGNILLDHGDARQAVDHYRRAAELDPHNPLPHFNLGNALLQLNRPKEAVVSYRAALKQSFWVAQVHTNLGNALVQCGDLGAAVASYHNALKAAPKYALASFNLARALARQGNFAAAIARLEEAIASDPDFFDAYFLLSAIKANRGDFGGAEAVVGRLIDGKPDDPERHYAAGRLLYAAGRFDDAEKHFRKTIALDPKRPGPHGNLGLVRLHRGDLDGAIDSFRRVLAIDPREAKAHDNLGIALYRKKDLDGAIRSHRAALEIDPLMANAHHNLAVGLRARGDLDGAVRHYWAGAKLHPHPKRLLLLAETLQAQWRDEAAVAVARRAVRLAPNDAHALTSLGMLCMQRGDYREAILALNGARNRLPAGHPLDAQLSNWVATCRAGVKLEARRPALLRQEGEEKKLTARENLLLGVYCGRGHRHRHAAAAVRFFATAFADEPALAESLDQGARHLAAVCAVTAATGRSDDARDLDAAVRRRLLRQAHDWLKADVLAWGQALEKTGNADLTRLCVVGLFRRWQTDADLAGVRDAEQLLRLPTEERLRWLHLLEQVDALLLKATS